MTKAIKDSYKKKWLTILKEYELVKRKQSKYFKKVKELCEAYGINGKDLGKYYGRWIMNNKDAEALVPKKRGPKPGSRKILTKEEERVIVKIHRGLNIDHRNIFHVIKGNEKFRIHPSATTIYRTLKNFPLGKKKKIVKRYERNIPGELTHADTHYLPKGTLIDRKKKIMIFGLIDDCTRMCYLELLKKFDSHEVARVFARGLKWFTQHGIFVEGVMTDNGPEFCSPPNKKSNKQHAFELMKNIFGIKQYRIQPYRPQTNGKIERFWRTFESEYLQNQTFKTFEDLEEEIEKYVYDYNYNRRHSAIKDMTPFDKLKKVTELLK